MNWVDIFGSISQHLFHHPSHGQLIAFAMAFLESLAIVGSIIPGSVTMTAIGVLIGSGILPLKLTALVTILGALAGDYFSYYVGIRYKATIYQWRFLQKRQHWLTQGEQLFKRYGIASIILGRFVGPMRSMMPMIAGIFDMPRSHFAIAILPSALLWSFFYLLPGIVLGALSLDMPEGLSRHFLSSLFIIILSLLLLHRLYKHYKPVCKHSYDHLLDRWGTCLSRESGSHAPFVKDCLHFLLLAAMAAIAFGLIAYIMLFWTPIQDFNHALYHFMQSTHLEWLNHTMLVVTLIADKHTLGLFAGMMALYGLIQRNLRFCIYICCQTAASAIVIQCVKLLFHVARPERVVAVLGHTSFPSGHTSFFTMMITVIYLVHRFHRPYKTPHFFWVAISIAIIALTRLYCGAHWLTDVLGGASIGFALALLGMSIYTYRPLDKWPKHMGVAVIITLLIAHISICHIQKARNYRFFFEPEPIKLVKHKNWQSLKSPLQTTRLGRLNQPTDPFNIQWAATNEPYMEATLRKQGWHVEAHPKHWYRRIGLMIKYPEMRFLSLLAHLHKDHKPAFIASKIDDNRLYVIEAWPTYYQLKENNKPLWLGTLYWYTIDSKADEPFHILKKKHYTTLPLQNLKGSVKKYHNLYIETK